MPDHTQHILDAVAALAPPAPFNSIRRWVREHRGVYLSTGRAYAILSQLEDEGRLIADTAQDAATRSGSCVLVYSFPFTIHR